MDLIEIIGIVSTVFVLLSFLMKDLVWVRIINIVGAIGFVVYGALINAFSTWLLNALLIVIHIGYLGKIYYDHQKKNKQAASLESNTISENAEEKTVETEEVGK